MEKELPKPDPLDDSMDLEGDTVKEADRESSDDDNGDDAREEPNDGEEEELASPPKPHSAKSTKQKSKVKSPFKAFEDASFDEQLKQATKLA